MVLTPRTLIAAVAGAALSVGATTVQMPVNFVVDGALRYGPAPAWPLATVLVPLAVVALLREPAGQVALSASASLRRARTLTAAVVLSLGAGWSSVLAVLQGAPLIHAGLVGAVLAAAVVLAAVVGGATAAPVLVVPLLAVELIPVPAGWHLAAWAYGGSADRALLAWAAALSVGALVSAAQWALPPAPLDRRRFSGGTY